MNFSLRLCEREDGSTQLSNSESSGSSDHPPAAASLSSATPSATSESIRAWVGSSPITLPALLPALILELRLLRSPGITRLRRYYEPLRHLLWPSLSLAGLSLTVTRRHHTGFPCCIDLLCQHAVARTPVRPRRICCSVLARSGARHTSSRRRPSLSLLQVGSHIAIFEDCPAFTHVTAC